MRVRYDGGDGNDGEGLVLQNNGTLIVEFADEFNKQNKQTAHSANYTDPWPLSRSPCPYSQWGPERFEDASADVNFPIIIKEPNFPPTFPNVVIRNEVANETANSIQQSSQKLNFFAAYETTRHFCLHCPAYYT